jgi:hypothetical protein
MSGSFLLAPSWRALVLLICVVQGRNHLIVGSVLSMVGWRRRVTRVRTPTRAHLTLTQRCCQKGGSLQHVLAFPLAKKKTKKILHLVNSVGEMLSQVHEDVGIYTSRSFHYGGKIHVLALSLAQTQAHREQHHSLMG